MCTVTANLPLHISVLAISYLHVVYNNTDCVHQQGFGRAEGPIFKFINIQMQIIYVQQ